MKERSRTRSLLTKKTFTWGDPELEALFRAYQELDDQLGEQFREAQQEAYESWCTREAEMDAQSGEE